MRRGLLLGCWALLYGGLAAAQAAPESPAGRPEPAAQVTPAAPNSPGPPTAPTAPAEDEDTVRAASRAGAAAPPPARERVQNYRLQINAPAELLDALRARTLLGRWREDPDFSVEQMPLFLARGREEALAIAQAAGYFSARVQVELQPADPAAARNEPPTVLLAVDGGARTTVSAFDLVLQGAAAGERIEQRLIERWPLPAGSFFRTGDWELGKRMLIEQLQSDGYLRARFVDSRARVDVELTAAQLSLTLDSGPRLRMGALTVRGLQRYPRHIIDDLRPFHEGDPYTLDAVLLFQQRLRAAGQFSSVTVLPDLRALEADESLIDVPLVVEVGERLRQRVTGGLGYSTGQGARLLAGYDHRNLFERGWVLESGLLLETVRGRAFANVRTPQRDDGRYWQAGLRSERLDTLGEFTRTQTVYVGRGRRDERKESFVSVQYQSELGVTDLGGGEEARQVRSALTLGWAWSLRELDSRVDPREGYSLSTQISGSAKGVASDRSFLRLYGRTMRFWPISGEGVLARGTLIGLAEAGWVVASDRDDIPSQNLFRAGGGQSVRGYRYLGLGIAQGDAIVGGRLLALGSLEYQIPVTGEWWGAAFIDAGNVADRVSDWRPVFGYGGGARWRSPIGPINLDLAYGDRDRRWRLHFSFGYSF